MKKSLSLSLEKDVDEFLAEGYNKSAKANHLLKETKEYKEYRKKQLGY